MFYLLLLHVHSRKSVICPCQSESSVEFFTWLLYCFTYYKIYLRQVAYFWKMCCHILFQNTVLISINFAYTSQFYIYCVVFFIIIMYPVVLNQNLRSK